MHARLGMHGAALDIKDIYHRLNSEHECTILRLTRTMTINGYLSLVYYTY
jgi:hypothetical protein